MVAVEGKPVDEHTDNQTRARQAHAAQDWATASAHFAAVAAERLTADDLAAYADAVWWLGRIEDNLRLGGAAYDAFLADSRPAEAAWAAMQLGIFHMSRGDEPQGLGWIGRAGRLVEGAPECPVHGLLLLVTAFVDSIGEPVGLVGWSGSGAWVLGAAARSPFVTAVAEYEPGVVSVMREDDLGRAFAFATLEQMGAAAVDGRLVDAVRAFAPWICTDEEIVALQETDFFERWAGGVPAMLRLVQQDASYRGVRPTDPEELARITVPVLLLRGEQTRLSTWFADATQYIAQHVPEPQVREVPGVGHFAPVLAPGLLAEELITFFESVRQPA